MISVNNLTKRYGNKAAVDDISFTVKKGEIVGFLGRNGAGKTTTMNIVTGYISSTSGTVTVDGFDILEDPLKAKRLIGYLPEHPPLYNDMTVNEYLGFAADIKSVPANKAKKHIGEVCELVKLTDVRSRLVGNLSKGYRQRVGMAQALIGNPEILIWDEPTVGLDPQQIIEIRGLIKNLGKNRTVILSSHILNEVADVCERVIIINKGKIVAEDTIANLSKGIGENNRMTVRIGAPERAVSKLLHEMSGVTYAESLGVKEPNSIDFVIQTDKETDIRKSMFNLLAKNGYPILMLKPVDVTLEDIFIKVTEEM